MKDSNKLGITFPILPGISQLPSQLLSRFERLEVDRGNKYKPRTKHLQNDGRPQFTNRLFLETSPYLLQHAHNPVNWHPWSNEPFETAAMTKRPVFVSIGYSTCHWCHVMEEESFEDLEIAKFLNENFICIKVDREERPDVDAVYMSAVQALTGRGGWPLNVWLAPDKRPFFGGTYFPHRDGDRGSSFGFLSLLHEIKRVFDNDPQRIESSALEITEAIQREPQSALSDVPTQKILNAAAHLYERRFDSINGGLMGSPKFPSTLPIRFLIREYRRTKESKFLEMARLTGQKMARGGMYDLVGGGFHRYSTDAAWQVPHFEKMLYDNALLAVAYLELFQVTGDKEFENVVHDILAYVQREMTSPQGGFYSATDADSKNLKGERDEGYYFTWTIKELDDALGKEKSKAVQDFFGVTSDGNFEGRNILHQVKSLTGFPFDLPAIRETLNAARNQKDKPLRDEKILTSWNGLMISAFARAGFVFDNLDYVSAAKKAAEFVLKNLSKQGVLYRSFKDGEAKHLGFLDDYAFFTAGLLDLFEATQMPAWIEKAIQLDEHLEKEFEDTSGGYFMTGNSHEKLIVREKPTYDGAEPSGNSVAALNLLRLFEYTTKPSYKKRAEKVFQTFSEKLTQQPTSMAEMLIALDFYHEGAREIVIVTSAGKEKDAKPFLDGIRPIFHPNQIVVVVEEGNNLDTLAKLMPWIAGKKLQEGKATAYLCEKSVCLLPTSDPVNFLEQI